jgi:anti-sigma B factor antagonist
VLGQIVSLLSSPNVELKFVANVCPIKVGEFEGFSWIRCEGKGSFLNSFALKEFGDSRISAGEKCLVIDLEECTAMDSTFMGTMAGLANRLNEKGAVLQIASANEKSRRSLEDLGLDYLMDINPEQPVWAGLEERARALLILYSVGMKAGSTLHTRHILEAHEILTDANEENREKFSEVIGLMKEQLGDKPSESP